MFTYIYIYLYIYTYIYIYKTTILPKNISKLLFRLHDIQYEILQKSNHLKEVFFINMFPLDKS